MMLLVYSDLKMAATVVYDHYVYWDKMSWNLQDNQPSVNKKMRILQYQKLNLPGALIDNIVYNTQSSSIHVVLTLRGRIISTGG